MSKPDGYLDNIFIEKPRGGSQKTLGLGVFDGLHRGHFEIAKHCDCLMTFYPHPDLVLDRIKTCTYLTTLEELKALFTNLAILRFSKDIAALQPAAFLDDIVMPHFSPKKIIVGYDYRFGYKGQGDTIYLKGWGIKNNVDVDVVQPVEHKGKLVKSGVIRDYIQTGSFNEAVDFLGHPYLLFGKVIPGNGIGRTIGFPTANLDVPGEKLLPLPGVYSAELDIDGATYKAALHIGTKPTFEDNVPSVEAHILDFEGDLYGKVIRLYINSKIRDIKAFSSKEALIAQIHHDVEEIRGTKYLD